MRPPPTRPPRTVQAELEALRGQLQHNLSMVSDLAMRVRVLEEKAGIKREVRQGDLFTKTGHDR